MQARNSSSQGFFRLGDSPVTKAVQIGNAIAAALTIYGYFKNPEASLLEYGFDVSVHVLQAFITENSSALAVLGSDAANAMRLFAITKNLAFGSSTIPTLLNLVDTGIHVGNVFSNMNLEESKSGYRM